MNPAAVRLGVGSPFLYDGELVEIVDWRYGGPSAGVTVVGRDGHLRRMTLRELLYSAKSRIVADGDGPKSDDPQETAATTLAMLTPAGAARVIDRAQHMRELLTGYRSGSSEQVLPDEPRSPYAPGVPMMSRYAAKAKELGKGSRTVQSWVNNYRKNGAAGLADKRDVRRDSRRRKDNRWIDTARDVMLESAGRSKPSQMAVIMRTDARVTAEYGKGSVWIPSQATAYRQLSLLEKTLPTFRHSTKRNRDIAGQPHGTYGKLLASRPGEYVYMDCNVLDVFAFDPQTLKPVTCVLTITMDAYTRCITGLRVTPISAKSIDAATVIFQMFCPPPSKPSWPAEAIWPDHGMPRSIAIEVRSVGNRPVGASGPAIVPETIVIDHGSIFISEHLNGVCQRLGISINPVRLGEGRDKGPLERFFRTLGYGLLELLPGYKGNDLTARGLEQ